MCSGAMLRLSSLSWVQTLKSGQAAGFLFFYLMKCGFSTVPTLHPTQTKARWLLSVNGWSNTESNHERNDR